MSAHMNLIILLTLSLPFMPIAASSGQSIPSFNLEAGNEFRYEINITFMLKSELDSGDGDLASHGPVNLDGALRLFQTILVMENIDNEYARLICRFDSLTGSIESISDGSPTKLEVYSQRDHIIIHHKDSMIAEYTPQGESGTGAGDFYRKLLFIGEDIEMLVYPNGEIINITENKNLWTMSRDLLGMPGEGFLEIRFPEENFHWEEAIEISGLGGFDLQDHPDPLMVKHRFTPGKNKIELNGDLFMRHFSSEASLPELDDRLGLELDNYQFTKSGYATFSTAKGTLIDMEYTASQIGNITVSGTGNEDYLIRMRNDLESRVSYRLLE